MEKRLFNIFDAAAVLGAANQLQGLGDQNQLQGLGGEDQLQGLGDAEDNIADQLQEVKIVL